MLTASFGFAQAGDAGGNARFQAKYGRSAQAAAQATQSSDGTAMAGMKCMQDGGMKGMKGMKGMSGKMAMPSAQDDTQAKPDEQMPAGHVHGAAPGAAAASGGCCGKDCCKHGE
jgi:hypothetical protein